MSIIASLLVSNNATGSEIYLGGAPRLVAGADN